MPALLVLLGGLALAASAGAATEDVAGAKDPQGIDRHTGAWIAFASPLGAIANHQVPVDRLARIEDFARGDVMRDVRGRSRSVTYAHPRGVSARAVYAHLRASLPEDVWFECAGRDCGESTYFAHDVFDVADLYGRNAQQFYVAVPRTTSEGRQILMLYVSERGTREVFAHVEEILLAEGVEAPGPARGPSAVASMLQASLTRSGVARVPGDPFAADGSIAAASGPLLDGIAEALRGQPPGRRLWLVVHMAAKPGAMKAAVDASLTRAETLRARLLERVPNATLSAFGAGGLAPAVLGDAPLRVEIVRD
ncbi:MAG TPA: DUF4892 domain-containing protein [Pseudomonadales bacterium]|nr:DUF4892 domain-containing protein [Pseudomonadales bacterium]